MKSKRYLKIAALFLAMLFTGVCLAQEKLPGLWVSAATGEVIRFSDDGNYVIMHASRSRRAKKALKEGKAIRLRTAKQGCSSLIWMPVQEGKYEVDVDRHPAWIDMVTEVKGKGIRVEGLFEFADADTLVMVTGQQRPATMKSRDFKIRFERAVACMP